MVSLSQVRWKLRGYLPQFVLILLVIQPLMDVLSFWMGEWGMSNTLTLMIRLGVLGLTILVGLCITRRRKAYWITLGVLAFICLGHMYACWDYGYADAASDLTNFIRVAQMPLTALSLITFLRENEDCYPAMKKGILTCTVLILAVEVLASLTGTEPHTYIDGTGFMGWFNNTNSQSSNLTLMAPVAVAMMYREYGFKSWKFWTVFLGSLAAMFFMGPRLCMLGIVATGVGLGVCMILIRPGLWKKALVFICAGLVFVGCIPFSPMVEHQKLYDGVQGGRQDGINEELAAFDLPALDEKGISQEELEHRKDLWQEALSHIYNVYAWDFVLIFGQRETMEMYNFTTSISELTALRPKKLQYARLLMNSSPVSARFFGLELSRFTVNMEQYGIYDYGTMDNDNSENYDVENDLHGIYFLYGYVGLFAMLAFLGYFLFLILRALIQDAKKYFTWDAAAWGIALCMCLAHVYNTAGVLRRPNASIYLSVVLAAVYYLVKIKTYPDERITLPQEG